MNITPRRVALAVLSGATSASLSAVLGVPTLSLLPGRDPGRDTGRAVAAAATVRTCYQADNRQVVRLDLEVRDEDYGVAYDSQVLWVRQGSPCRDINVRDPRNVTGPAAGQSACTLVKVMFGNMEVMGWVDTCGRWQEVARLVPEGRPFLLRAALRPVDVTVAS